MHQRLKRFWKECFILSLENSTVPNNTLSADADWFKVANEVADVLLGLSSRAEVEKIELYPSYPAIIAFAVGMVLGVHARIEAF